MQMLEQHRLLLRTVRRLSHRRDTHGLTDMRQPVQPIGLFDQPQQQANLCRALALRREASRIEEYIAAIEPMTGHLRRLGKEHVQVEIRPQESLLCPPGD
ncbi:hypothetical protein D3C81_1650640 [compost metagenome]